MSISDALTRARNWLAGDGDRQMGISITASRAWCHLSESRAGIHVLAGSGDQGEHYQRVEAEIEHAVTAALDEAGAPR